MEGKRDIARYITSGSLLPSAIEYHSRQCNNVRQRVVTSHIKIKLHEIEDRYSFIC